MRHWPQLTQVQRKLMRELDAAPHGTIRYPINRTYLRLVFEGFVYGETIISSFCTITQRGRDYVRFGMRHR